MQFIFTHKTHYNSLPTLCYKLYIFVHVFSYIFKCDIDNIFCPLLQEETEFIKESK